LEQQSRPLVVLSSGRSGSTFLQKLLNTHPALAIWGEHGGILNHLAASWNVVSQLEWMPEQEPSGLWLLAQDRPVNEARWTAWDGSFSKQDYTRYLREFVDSLFARDIRAGMRWGFKEIRYHKMRFIEFFSALYPGAQFVLLIRDPVDVCVSFASARDRDGTAGAEEIRSICEDVKAKQLAPFQVLVQEATSKHPDRCLLVSYEALRDAPVSTMDGLARFLQLQPGFDPGPIALVANNDIVSERKRAGSARIAFLKQVAIPLLTEELTWHRERRETSAATTTPLPPVSG
jgi:hypothetical protein